METLPRYSEVSEQATGIPRAMPGKQLNNNTATSICLRATEIILRTFCTVSHKLSSYVRSYTVTLTSYIGGASLYAEYGLSQWTYKDR